jgi:hypothetical protein
MISEWIVDAMLIAGMQINPRSSSRHRLCEELAVRANSVLGGLHHEYFWAPSAASLSICG